MKAGYVRCQFGASGTSNGNIGWVSGPGNGVEVDTSAGLSFRFSQCVWFCETHASVTRVSRIQHDLKGRGTVFGALCVWGGRFGCVPVAVRWRLVNGAEWLDACVFVAVGAQQAKP